MKIVAIGDSITYGFPYTPSFSWVHLASRELGIPIINKGINGDTTTGMMKRFTRDVNSCSPSHVIITGGTNDAFSGVEAEEVDTNLRSMVDIALKSGITPMIGLPIPCTYSRDEYILGLYREDMREYAVANNIGIIDFYTAFKTIESKNQLYNDAVHPNEEGYRVMANTVLNAIMTTIQR